MTIGLSLLLIAVGAILKFAVTASIAGLSLGTVGVILMVVGGIGLLIALFLLRPQHGAGARYTRRPPPPTTVREREYR